VSNHPDEFPDLNLYALQRYARRWAAERPGVKDIRLYHYRSILYSRYMATEKAKYYSTKYAIVFDGDDLEKLSNDITDDQGIYPKLIDNSFLDVYRVKPVAKFQYDWTFTTADRAVWNQFSSIMVNESYWDLYPAEEKLIETAPATEAVALKENSLDINASEPLTEEQAEKIIKAMTVIRVSDTEIIIKYGNEEINAACEDMGFKSYAKTWQMFMSILQDKNHQYFVGKYDKKHPVHRKDYLSKSKLFGNFSKKFIVLINDKFSLSLPGDFNIFQNMKHKERAGIYQAKFRVDENQKPNQQVDIKNLSKEATLERLAALKKQCEDEKNTDEKYRLSIEIAQYCDHAIKKHSIPEGELRSFFPLPDDKPSENDMMELIAEVTDKNKSNIF
jgi:hypothetical protein